MTTREDVFSTLFDTLSAITWGTNDTWAHASRRLALFADVAQPAMMLTAHDETIRQRAGGDYYQSWKASVLIYHQTGDVSAIPQQTDNLILDAVFAALAPDDALGRNFTLGGRVSRCFVDGAVRKFPGDLDGQSMIVIPITIIVP